MTGDAATEVPDALVEVTDRVDRRLAEVLDAERSRWVAIDPALTEPFDVLAELVLVGGKRLRPAFFHWAHVGAGGAPWAPAAIDAAAAIEMLHAFALAHDDIMDASDSRRGHPTVHVRFADLHRNAGWQGDAAHFGEAVAILVGDMAHVMADHLMAGRSPQIAHIWDELRLEVNVGQYLDVLAGARGHADEVEARRILEYKTGRYSVERPLQLGVALAGRPELVDAGLAAYGRPVGVAFQLRDDLLGAFGDATVTGKPVGDDLREGKPTPLLAAARRLADPAQLAVLQRAGCPDLGDDELAAMQAILVETGAAAAIETEIDSLTTGALAALDRLELVGGAGDALRDLAHFVAYRTH
ncbi:MAG: polyprenyl synthetase family protein [Acidimicrobiales bacterium]